jgi:transcription elongation factor Elf1
MTSFSCRGCGKDSAIREVKTQSGTTALICQNCGAENVVRTRGGSEPIEVIGLKPQTEMITTPAAR